jgi:hypothetical protein
MYIRDNINYDHLDIVAETEHWAVARSSRSTAFASLIVYELNPTKKLAFQMLAIQRVPGLLYKRLLRY